VKFERAADPDRKIRSTGAYKRWRKAVKARDGHRCVVCGSRKQLQAHHIVPPRDGGAPYGLENGETRCPSCHRRRQTELIRERERAAR